MSFSINQVILAGNVSQEPELKYTPNGTAVCTFSVATSRSVKKGEQWENVPTFHRITVWQKLAEFVSNNLVKGQQVTVRGRIDNRTYEDQQGVKKYITDIVAEDVVFSAPKKGTTTTAPKQTAQPQRPAQSAPVTNDEPIVDPDTGEVMF